MIESLLPLSKNKMDILTQIYERQPTHSRKIALELKIHPYLTKKYIDNLASKQILEQQRAGRIILLTINSIQEGIEQVIYLIESYKQATDHKILKNIIKNLLEHFAQNNAILSCVLFGSYARGAATKDSDVDILFVIKNPSAQAIISKKLSQLGTLMNLNFSPVIMSEEEFHSTLTSQEPTTITLLKPSQRIIISGIEYFIRATIP